MANIFFRGVDELFAGRAGTPFNAEGQRDYIRRFRVLVRDSAKGFGAVAICSAPGLPRPYSPYVSTDNSEVDLLALCVKLSAKQEHEDDWQSWIVEANYSTRIPNNGPPKVGNTESPDRQNSVMNNPENEPPEIEWDYEVVQRAPQRDLDGKAFKNSANQPFSPPPTFEVAYPVLVMTRNENDFNVKVATGYAYAVNSDVFLGAKPGTAQCLPPKAKMQFKGNLSFWRVTYRIRFGPPKAAQAPANRLNGGNPLANAIQAARNAANAVLGKINQELESWQPQILDAGTLKKSRGGNPALEGKPVPIIKNGIAVTGPVLLDGQGNEQQPDANGEIQPVFLQFRVYQAKPFNRLINRGFVQ